MTIIHKKCINKFLQRFTSLLIALYNTNYILYVTVIEINSTHHSKLNNTQSIVWSAELWWDLQENLRNLREMF